MEAIKCLKRTYLLLNIKLNIAPTRNTNITKKIRIYAIGIERFQNELTNGAK